MKEKPFKFKIGDQVYYHPIIDQPHTGEVFEIIMRWRLDTVPHRRNVYKLVGKAGAVAEQALTHA